MDPDRFIDHVNPRYRVYADLSKSPLPERCFCRVRYWFFMAGHFDLDAEKNGGILKAKGSKAGAAIKFS